jgi:hypothetical protein
MTVSDKEKMPKMLIANTPKSNLAALTLAQLIIVFLPLGSSTCSSDKGGRKMKEALLL